jgi:outer membrane protein
MTLTLEQAQQEAVEHSPILREARSRQREARFRVDEAYTQAYPTVALQTNGSRVTPPVTVDFGGRSIDVSPEYNYTAQLVLRQTLFTFGRLKWSAAAAELNEQAVKAEGEARRRQVLEEATLAYYDTLVGQEGVRIAEDQLRAREAHLRDAQLLVKVGSAALFDVKRDEAALAQGQQQLLEAQNRAALARVRLFTLMQRRDQGESLEPAPEILPAAPVQDVEAALQRRPDLAASRWAVAAADARYRLAQTQDNPSLALQTDYTVRNATGFAPPAQWTVGLNLQIPLFDGGLTEARSGQAQEVAEQLRALLDQAERNARLELESLRLDALNRQQRLAVAQRNLESATEALRIARLRYQNGLSTNVELLDAQAAVTAAQQDGVASRYQYLQTLARWRRASAEGGTP